ncbi:uncharacterized protein METZ01_LOCUS174103, partial [marine metagenome]
VLYTSVSVSHTGENTICDVIGADVILELCQHLLGQGSVNASL